MIVWVMRWSICEDEYGVFIVDKILVTKLAKFGNQVG